MELKQLFFDRLVEAPYLTIAPNGIETNGQLIGADGELILTIAPNGIETLNKIKLQYEDEDSQSHLMELKLNRENGGAISETCSQSHLMELKQRNPDNGTNRGLLTIAPNGIETLSFSLPGARLLCSQSHLMELKLLLKELNIPKRFTHNRT